MATRVRDWCSGGLGLPVEDTLGYREGRATGECPVCGQRAELGYGGRLVAHLAPEQPQPAPRT